MQKPCGRAMLLVRSRRAACWFECWLVEEGQSVEEGWGGEKEGRKEGGGVISFWWAVSC